MNLNRLRVFEKQISNSLQKAMKKNTSLQPLLYKIIFPSLCRALHSVLVAADFTSGKPVPVYSARNLISYRTGPRIFYDESTVYLPWLKVSIIIEVRP